MNIERTKNLNQLISKRNNGMIKIITGLRRSGKSYLLMNIFYNYLINNGIKEKNIIRFAFDNDEDISKLNKYLPDEETKIIKKYSKNYYINANKFNLYIKDLTNGKDDFYILLDEVQLLEDFEYTLNGFLYHKNYDVYVTGSNSKFLSTDIITEFRGRGDQIHLLPLSFREFNSFKNMDFNSAYEEYSSFGGLPQVLFLNTIEEKSNYLKNLYNLTYVLDIVERNKINDIDSFNNLINLISSSIGSYINPVKIENTFLSVSKIKYSHMTIQNHIDYLIDSFLINKVMKYDIKGKKYINANYKYYFSDIGLRNARLNFRQNEPTHIMENIIYNELIYRNYNVDIGIVEVNEKNINGNNVVKQLETDFVCNKIDETIYIQSVYSMEDEETYIQESNSLRNIQNSFKKIIIVRDGLMTHYTDDGILIMTLKDFLNGREL